MNDLRVTLIQNPIRWEDPAGTILSMDQLIQSPDLSTDVIVFCEMFSTGFSMDSARLAESMDGPTVRWMQVLANHHHALVMGSLIIKDGGKYYNRCICAFPDRSILYYDKVHLFTLANEHLHYSKGASKLVFEFRDWKIMPFICYDLRFPVWLRNVDDIELLIGVAQFPAKRRQAWLSLLTARSIENVCYAVGVNGLGIDGNQIEYSGDSGVWNFEGTRILDLGSETGIRTTVLSKEKLKAFRKAYPF
ncbi:MAG: hypothetical protein IPM48_00060 [Saprospiraceae bacterium]|nr:hypothetical protein [Saprospiraceae bacterium]